MQLHEVEQKTEEWYKLRLGKITASGFSKLLGSASIRDKYLYDRAAEIVTGERSDSDELCGGVHINRGNEWEAVARDKYILATFSDVKEIGLVQLNDYVACSPDGLVGEDGLIEIKVPDSNNYFRQLIEISQQGTSAIAEEHLWQMQFCMYVTGRKWCDYVLYNPKHEANNKALFIYRVEKDNNMHDNISNRLQEGIETIQKYVGKYFGFNKFN